MAWSRVGWERGGVEWSEVRCRDSVMRYWMVGTTYPIRFLTGASILTMRKQFCDWKVTPSSFAALAIHAQVSIPLKCPSLFTSAAPRFPSVLAHLSNTSASQRVVMPRDHSKLTNADRAAPLTALPQALVRLFSDSPKSKQLKTSGSDCNSLDCRGVLWHCALTNSSQCVLT